MARKKKIQIEKHPGVPRGAEHVAERVLAGDQHPRLTPSGAEISSNEPMVLHLNRRRVVDVEAMRRAIENLRATSGPVEFESFEEADDFDLEDDFGEFTSRWEIPADHDDAVEAYKRYRATGEIPQDLAAAIAAKAPAGPPLSPGLTPISQPTVAPKNDGLPE